jgi:hypothetical protein
LNKVEDAYEWEPQGFENEEHQTCQTSGGCVQLVSTGAGAFPSKLLGISADGENAYFFTREKLVAEDGNGNSTKIYDAREGGGFPFVPSPVPCKASDECHGPGSLAPAPPEITSVVGTTEIPSPTCKRPRVKRHGKCVKPKRKTHERHSRHRDRHAQHHD